MVLRCFSEIYSSAAVTVIINQTGKKPLEKNQDKVEKNKERTYSETINVEETSLITSDMLKYYYDNQMLVTIQAESYSILIDGGKIKNCNNVFDARLCFVKNESGTEFVLNEGKYLITDKKMYSMKVNRLAVGGGAVFVVMLMGHMYL